MDKAIKFLESLGYTITANGDQWTISAEGMKQTVSTWKLIEIAENLHLQLEMKA